MSALFTSGAVPATARPEYWRHVMSEVLGPLEPRGHPDRLLVGEAMAVLVGELVQRRPGGATRTRGHARAARRPAGGSRRRPTSAARRAG